MSSGSISSAITDPSGRRSTLQPTISPTASTLMTRMLSPTGNRANRIAPLRLDPKAIFGPTLGQAAGATVVDTIRNVIGIGLTCGGIAVGIIVPLIGAHDLVGVQTGRRIAAVQDLSVAQHIRGSNSHPLRRQRNSRTAWAHCRSSRRRAGPDQQASWPRMPCHWSGPTDWRSNARPDHGHCAPRWRQSQPRHRDCIRRERCRPD